MSKFIEVAHLNVQIGKSEILQDISFSLWEGDYVGLIGPNGAGKTTLIKTIMGANKQYTGSISIDTSVRIGYVPQSFLLSHVAPISVREVLNMSRKTSISLEEVLGKVGLDVSFLGRNFHELSGWQKQRVIIARALATDPNMLIFDEPLTGVDYETKIKMYALFECLNKEEGMTILFVSHEIDQIINSCHHVLCLNKTMHTGCHPLDFARWQIDDCPVLHTGAHVVPVHHHHHSHNQDTCC